MNNIIWKITALGIPWEGFAKIDIGIGEKPIKTIYATAAEFPGDPLAGVLSYIAPARFIPKIVELEGIHYLAVEKRMEYVAHGRKVVAVPISQ